MIVRVDPMTMAPMGPPAAPEGLLEWSRRLHHDFLLPDHGGRSIVGWVGVGLVVLSLTGIPIWWPAPGQWRAAFTFSTSARGVRFHRGLHGATGVWVVTLLLISAVTGAILSFPRTVRDVLGMPPVGVPRATSSEQSVTVPMGNLDAALALAVSAAPGTTPRTLFPPTGTGAPIRVVLAPEGGEGAARSVIITVDAAASRVVGTRDFRTATEAELALLWVHDIHFGQGLGLVWRMLAIVAGLALPIFAVSGTAMWLLRNRDHRRLDFRRRASLPAGE